MVNKYFLNDHHVPKELRTTDPSFSISSLLRQFAYHTTTFDISKQTSGHFISCSKIFNGTQLPPG